jgi:hypothetical protein
MCFDWNVEASKMKNIATVFIGEVCWQNHWQHHMVKGLHQPLDGITNPKYKLLHFLTTKYFFAKRRMH